MKKLLGITLLLLAISITGYAGDIPGNVVSPPPSSSTTTSGSAVTTLILTLISLLR